MRKIILALSGIALLMALAAVSTGCGTQASAGQPALSQDKYASVQTGMTTDQLKSIAGDPARTETKSMGGGHSMGGGTMSGGSMTMEYWYYQGGKGWVRFEIADGKVTAKSGY